MAKKPGTGPRTIRPHFAHLISPEFPNQCRESAIHVLAKVVLADFKELPLPAWIRELPTHYSSWNEPFLPPKERLLMVWNPAPIETLAVEEKVGSIRPDLHGTITLAGKSYPLIIEIAVTHHVTPEKIATIREMGAFCIEIDLADITDKVLWDHDSFAEEIRSPARMRWINCPPAQAAFDALDHQTRKLALDRDVEIARYVQDCEESGRGAVVRDRARQAVLSLESMTLRGWERDFPSLVTRWGERVGEGHFYQELPIAVPRQDVCTGEAFSDVVVELTHEGVWKEVYITFHTGEEDRARAGPAPSGKAWLVIDLSLLTDADVLSKDVLRAACERDLNQVWQQGGWIEEIYAVQRKKQESLYALKQRTIAQFMSYCRQLLLINGITVPSCILELEEPITGPVGGEDTRRVVVSPTQHYMIDDVTEKDDGLELLIPIPGTVKKTRLMLWFAPKWASNGDPDKYREMGMSALKVPVPTLVWDRLEEQAEECLVPEAMSWIFSIRKEAVVERLLEQEKMAAEEAINSVTEAWEEYDQFREGNRYVSGMLQDTTVRLDPDTVANKAFVEQNGSEGLIAAAFHRTKYDWHFDGPSYVWKLALLRDWLQHPEPIEPGSLPTDALRRLEKLKIPLTNCVATLYSFYSRASRRHRELLPRSYQSRRLDQFELIVGLSDWLKIVAKYDDAWYQKQYQLTRI